VAAGVVAAGTLEALSDRGEIAIDAFHILNPAAPSGTDFPFLRSTGLFPEWLLATMPNTPRQLTEQVARLLLDVTPDMSAAKAAGLTGWTPALDYQAVHEAMQLVRQNVSITFPLSFSMGSYSLGLFLILLAGFGGTMWYRHYRNNQRMICTTDAAETVREIHKRPNRPRRQPTRPAGQNGQGEEPALNLEQISNTPCFQSTLTAHLVVSPESRYILAANSRAGQLLGYPVHQLAGMSCETLGIGFDPDSPVHNNLALDAISSDGRTVSIKTSITFMRLAEGDALLISFLDNSETAALKKQLVRAKATADAASTAKGQFLANMNHEIRTPLNGIVSMVDLLMQSPMSEEHLEYVGIIQQSTKALVSIVNDVMDYCKIESGRIKIESAAIEIASMVANTAQTYSRIAQTKGVGFSCVIDPKLPKWIRCDPIRLQQVIDNLLDNAVKFTQKGNIHLHVELVERQADSVSIRFQIGDTGIGIEDDRLASIFDSFSQGGGHLIQKPTGIGLGLTIAKHLIGLMGGDLKVASTPGEGSRFWFQIDFNVASTSKLPLRPVREAPPQESVSDAPVRILLVEDNSVNQKVAVKILTKTGFTVDVADNGRQALDILTRQRFDLILMDIKMPEMDGLETTRRIRHPQSRVLDKNIPIIAVTANAMRTDRQQCLDSGMNDYLTKPIDAVKLLETISSWLPKNRSRDDYRPAARNLSAHSESMSPPDGGEVSPQATHDDAFQQSLLEQFMHQMPGHLHAIRVKSASGHIEAIKDMARSLKGAATGLRATALASAAQRLEMIDSRTPDTLRDELILGLEIEYQRLMTRLGNNDLHHAANE
jgi:signal transduction histidine kinase/DNA-binding response OmpR family regulator